MARYDHLPIYREAFDLALYFETTDPTELVARVERFDREVAPLV